MTGNREYIPHEELLRVLRRLRGVEASGIVGPEPPKGGHNKLALRTKVANQRNEINNLRGKVDSVLMVLNDLLKNRTCFCGGWTCPRCIISVNEAHDLTDRAGFGEEAATRPAAPVASPEVEAGGQDGNKKGGLG